MYRSQFANQVQQSPSNITFRSDYNDRQQYNTTDSSFTNAAHSAQVGNDVMPYSNFQNGRENMYQCTNFGQPERVSPQLVMGGRMYNTALFGDCDHIHGRKRKADEDYSPFYRGEKIRITDEHMAAGMNSLFITNDHSYCNNVAMFKPNDAEVIDTSIQFGSTSDDPQNDIDGREEEEQRKEFPVFHFTAPLEQVLKKKNDILPPKIIQEICKPCLAMVPWIPPLHNKSTMRDEQEVQEQEVMASPQDEMEDDNFEL